MNPLAEAIDNDLRLAILQLLAGQPGGELNARQLHIAVVGMRFRVSGDKIVTELDWMKEQRVVELEALDRDVTMAKITPRGREHLNGLIIIRGITEPGS